jgi:hypothetical protein
MPATPSDGSPPDGDDLAQAGTLGDARPGTPEDGRAWLPVIAALALAAGLVGVALAVGRQRARALLVDDEGDAR